MSYFEKAQFQPTIWGQDAFGKLRVSEPLTLFDSKQNVTNGGGVWDQLTLSGTSTFQPSGAQTAMSVVAFSGAYVIRQSLERMNYSPGKSQNILLTATSMDPQTNVIKRIGYFNSDGGGTYASPYDSNRDGVWFEASGSTFSVKIGNNGVEETATQSQWNIDTLNGSGPSGKTVTDWSKNQIYGIDFEWLGVGSVRYYTVIDGQYCYIHQFNHANSGTGVYMSTPNHSVRYEIRSIGGSGTLNHICSTVQSEGGSEPRTINREINNGSAGVTGPNANISWAALAFRKNPAVVNAPGIGLNIDSLEITSTAVNAQGGWQMIIDPTIAGAALTWTNVPNASGIQYAIGAATNTTSGGTAIAGGFWNTASKGNTIDKETKSNIGVGISGNAQVLVVAPYSTQNTVTTNVSANLKLTY